MNSFCQLLVFTIDCRRFALQLKDVVRAVRMVEIAPLPKAPEIVLGAITVQGTIVPVLDMRRRLGLAPRTPELDDHLLIARTSRRTVALIADTVDSLIELAHESIVAPASIVPSMEYVTGVTRLDDGLVFIHDLDSFLSLEEEQTLEASLAL